MVKADEPLLKDTPDLERASEVEESWAAGFSMRPFVTLFMLAGVVLCWSSLASIVLEFPNKWDLCAVYSLCTVIVFCGVKARQEAKDSTSDDRATYIGMVQGFCTLYLPYYMVTVMLMIMMSEAKYGSIYSVALAISLLAYARLLQTTLLSNLPSASEASCVAKLWWSIYGSIFLAILVHSFARMISQMKDSLCFFKNI